MTRAFIGIGSNVGDRHAHVSMVRDALPKLPGTALVAFSPVYETDPVGPMPQEKYLNAAALLETTLPPADLLRELRAIEARTGRPPVAQRVHWGPRTLDLDILLYGDQVICNDELTIPHPRLHERWFVLKPMADLDPAAIHPLLHKTIGELLAAVEAKPA
ncbi:MAG: 2-amino-4-hydroxy-6-hydroxymethyldihydropteridine diphosphokinase [Planctomycetes bacterium]|nr:2-amino-4-hydroxy-6-hydroxymethyldihydropteridine diphosphokinase [Planctomycetota bacterium]